MFDYQRLQAGYLRLLGFIDIKKLAMHKVA